MGAGREQSIRNKAENEILLSKVIATIIIALR